MLKRSTYDQCDRAETNFRFLGVKMEELTKIPAHIPDTDVIHVFMGKVESEQAKNALQIADKLSDMILFHSRVRENGAEMMEV